MEAIFSQNSWLVWATVLAIALFFPVRHLIWAMSVNRAARKSGDPNVSDDVRAKLKRRAGITAALLSYTVSILYSYWLFHR